MKKYLGYPLLFLLLLIPCLAWLMPIATANRFLPAGTQLLNLYGTIHQGSWQDIQIDNKHYPLTCQYQRTSGLSYHLTCQTPFEIDMLLTPTLSGDADIHNTLIAGELSDAAAWLRLLNIPGGLSGKFGINIEQATITDQTLTQLNISGGAEQIALLNQPILENVRIETLNPNLTSSQPIQLEIKTTNEPSNTANPVSLYLTSDIDGRNYLTQGELKGNKLNDYAIILRFFGQQIAHDTFTIAMQGRLF